MPGGLTLGFAMFLVDFCHYCDDSADIDDIRREFRALVIEIVLATDMSFHFQQIKNVRHLLSTPEKSVQRREK